MPAQGLAGSASAEALGQIRVRLGYVRSTLGEVRGAFSLVSVVAFRREGVSKELLATSINGTIDRLNKCEKELASLEAEVGPFLSFEPGNGGERNGGV